MRKLQLVSSVIIAILYISYFSANAQYREVNHKELVQSLKPLGKPRWITDDSAKYDSYMALGEDTKEHCAKCY